jgi:EAL domain-containing protein (putative c-di-GMP-specific phosphodiesterase class I)
VKLSGESLNNRNFLPYLYNCLSETGINGKSFVFQIDYSEYRAHPAIVKNFILGIKKAQCLFAFDHFGFGQFRSLDLQELPIDYLKIDGAFIRDLLDNPEHRSTIKRVISASRPLNIKTIAKSVENANTLAALWNLGVDAVQGYFLQEPSEVMKYNFSYQNEDE